MKTLISIAALMLLVCSRPVLGHDWHLHGSDHSPDQEAKLRDQTQSQNSSPSRAVLLTSYSSPRTPSKLDIAQLFDQFKNVKTRQDNSYLYIESNGLPDHEMMVGIRNWQQQVPIPQPFTGSNSWKLPLNPTISSNPISVRRNPLRGAIAIAVNGVPIFCALNNRGEDAYVLGELDKWGGHCGRGDDYHYHIAPIHLEKIVGKGKPIAFALDGFPIYGYTQADGSSVGKLDEYNGQYDQDGNYHYHATKTFPYINGGLRGKVTIRGDQIEQPRDSPVREGMPPLRGAIITGFKTNGDQRMLTYELYGRTAKISYSPVGSDQWKFTYTDTNGRTQTSMYQRRSQQGGQRGNGPPPRGDRGGPPPRPGDGNRPPRPFWQIF